MHLERWFQAPAGCDDLKLREFVSAAINDPAVNKLLSSVFGNSPFLSQCLISDQFFAMSLLCDGPDKAFTLAKALANDGSGLGRENIDELKYRLRIAKRRAALAIGVADISNLWTLERITGALSEFACVALEATCRALLLQLHNDGDLTLPDPEQPEKDSGLIVLGMGKLGAQELNYSSDIDLILLYDQDVVPFTGKGSLQHLFTRFSRNLVSVMDERTKDGYVFRTDLRLRPDPGATPPVMSVLAAETYYESMGQNWERAAMIKARSVAGDKHAGGEFLQNLTPFMWRKSLDFAAIQDIQSIKRQINTYRGGAEIAVAGHNIKLGRGGIREIEFYAQTQQLIWGGRNPDLRVRGTIQAIEQLCSAGHVAMEALTELNEAYDFLRRVEHRLQMIEDRQTHELPVDNKALKAVALFLGFSGIDGFQATLLRHLKSVERHYAALFEGEADLAGKGNLVFTGADEDPETQMTLAEMGFKEPSAVATIVRTWHTGRYRAMRSTRARELLTELVPSILGSFSGSPDPDLALRRFNEFLEGLPAGVQLFSLFSAHPGLFDLLAEIMGAAPRLAGWLSRYPILLDGVLERDFFEPLPGPEVRAVTLEAATGQARDLEDFLDIQRRWANDSIFQIGVHMLRGHLTPVEASGPLSDIADTCLKCLLPEIERDFAGDHGRVPDATMAIVALGKLGSREMTPGSDLDLLFVYDCPTGVEKSDGKRPLSPGHYYSRLCQRFIGAIAAPTGEGTLYDVDMRLRPAGNAGPIASSLEAFKKYQQNDAWTWEHQALTRARVVFAEGELEDRFNDVVHSVLTVRRDNSQLLRDVSEMRRRMREEHGSADIWSIKTIPGGMLDIEFIAQYLKLKHAVDVPKILEGDTVTALAVAANTGLIDVNVSANLVEAMLLWRNLEGILRLTVDGDFLEENAPIALKRVITRAAGANDFETLRETIKAAATKNAANFRLFFG